LIEQLAYWDEQLFLLINGKHNTFYDFVMFWASEKFIWIPLYALLLYYLVRHYRRNTIAILLFIVLLVFLTDQTSVWIKNSVERMRPCHEPALAGLVHIVREKCGGTFGFVSSHAANHFGLVAFLSFLIKKTNRYIVYLLVLWAIFVSYSRIYLGVHYPGDILFGALLGIILGWLVFLMAKLACLKSCLNQMATE
jgi:undecaprenyl-diphosphatase